MTRRTTILAAAVMIAVAAAVRINNALLFPFVRGYDGFAHFGYIWFLDAEGRVPGAKAGWEFFQPPAYYAVMLAFWKGLPGVDSLLRLRIGTAFVGLLGLSQAFVAWRMVKRFFPDEHLLHLLAIGLMLFLPVHLYSAGFLGNEGFGAALCSLALLALLWTMDAPTPLRAIVLGLTLGAAMLVKFTAVVVVAAAFGTIGLKALLRRDLVAGTKTLAFVASAMLAVCGWFYARNVMVYGNPFQMSRDQAFLAQIENSQLQGQRRFLEYVLFDPLILYRPQWPRGLTLWGEKPWDYQYSALRESIPTGLYANTWFDGFGYFVLPLVTKSEAARRAGQLLLTLGMLPTLLMVVGVFAGLARLRRKGWDDTIVAMLMASAAMAAVVIQGTRSVPTQAAVKATYLTPVSVAFAFWFVLGAHTLLRSRPLAQRIVAGWCALLATASVVVFTHGLAIDNDWMTKNGGGAIMRNLHGVIYYAGGETEKARSLFDWAAQDGWPLAQENLAALALQEGRPIEALYRLRQARAGQALAFNAGNSHQKAYLQTTLADYDNTRAVILQQLGWRTAAMNALASSRDLDSAVPEIWYDLGVMRLLDAAPRPKGNWRDAFLEQARRDLQTAANIDPAFREADAMRGVADILGGGCAAGNDAVRSALAPHLREHRAYPLLTGPGDQNSASIRRRMRIPSVPGTIDPYLLSGACGNAGA